MFSTANWLRYAQVDSTVTDCTAVPASQFAGNPILFSTITPARLCLVAADPSPPLTVGYDFGALTITSDSARLTLSVSLFVFPTGYLQLTNPYPTPFNGRTVSFPFATGSPQPVAIHVNVLDDTGVNSVPSDSNDRHAPLAYLVQADDGAPAPWVVVSLTDVNQTSVSTSQSPAQLNIYADPAQFPTGQQSAAATVTISSQGAYKGTDFVRVTATVPPVFTYYFSDLTFGGGFQTTLTYINYSPQAVSCVTNFYSDSGGPLSIPFSQGTVSTRTDALQPGQSIHDQTVANLTAAVTEGWAQSSCTGSIEASLLYRYYANGVAVSEAGVNAETAPTTSFVTFAQTATGVAYANPSPTQSAAVTFNVMSNAGATLGSNSIMLGPLAHGSANLGQLLGLQSFTGMVEITSTIPIVSLSLNAEAFPVISSLPPGDLPAGFGGGGGTTSYYFSDLAFGGGFQTTLTLINYSPQAVTCTTSFYSDSGGPLSVPFGQGTNSTRIDVLPAGGSIHDQTAASLTAMVAEGWAQSSCTGSIEASLLYRYYTNGVAASEAGVNAETAPTTEFATFAETATGVAYANPSTTQSAMITLTLYSTAGTQLGSHIITLGPLAHNAANLGPLFGLASFTGFVKITSTIPIISLSLNAEAFPVISSLPPGDLPGSTPLVP